MKFLFLFLVAIVLGIFAAREHNRASNLEQQLSEKNQTISSLNQELSSLKNTHKSWLDESHDDPLHTQNLVPAK